MRLFQQVLLNQKKSSRIRFSFQKLAVIWPLAQSQGLIGSITMVQMALRLVSHLILAHRREDCLAFSKNQWLERDDRFGRREGL
jgi:hypothetical protein